MRFVFRYMDYKEKIMQEAEAEEDPLMPPVV